MRAWFVAAILFAGVWAAAPSDAHAQDLPRAAALLSGLVADWTLETIRFDDAGFIRLSEPVDAPKSAVEQARGEAVVALLGRGLDVSGDLTGLEPDGSILLELEPNLGKRGGLLRCTFRF